MTAPTRGQVEEWKAAAYRHATDTVGNMHLDRDDAFLDRWRRTLIDHVAALAFAAGQSAASDHADLLRRCRPIVQADAQMMADISRHAPLDPTSQATHDTTEYESEKLLPLIDAALADHIVDPNKMVGSGAELVREIEEASARYQVDALKASTRDYQAEGVICAFQWWPRLRAALISGDATREDAKRLRVAMRGEGDERTIG